MSRPKKKWIIYVCLALIILSGVAIFGIYTYVDIVRQRELEANELEIEMAEQRRIMETYERVNVLFGLATGPYSTFGREAALLHGGRFRPLRETPAERNSFGIETGRYILLRMYYHQTGMLLAYETVIEYFSQEFEPCGALRLYNNGKHPELEAFVEWMWEEPSRLHSSNDYLFTLYTIHQEYNSVSNDAGFVRQDFFALSPQMLDALARAEADPDYILDLTNLQQQGY